MWCRNAHCKWQVRTRGATKHPKTPRAWQALYVESLENRQLLSGDAPTVPLLPPIGDIRWSASYDSANATLSTALSDAEVAGPSVVSVFPSPTVVDSITYFLIEFDRGIDPESFSFSDDIVSFVGPDGADLRSQITDVFFSGSFELTRMRIGVDSTTAIGTYRLIIGPGILAAADGAPMDQDGDGIAGEQVEDRYTAQLEVVPTTTADGFGYLASAATYSNDDLRTGMPGVRTAVTQRGASSSISLGTNSFNFYGHSYKGSSQLYVNSNGLITFGGAAPAGLDPNFIDLTTSPVRPTIAVLAGNWNYSSVDRSAILYRFDDLNGDSTPDRLVIEWSDVRTDTKENFQAALELNTGSRAGDIVLNYLGQDQGQQSALQGPVGVKDQGTQGSRRLLISPWDGFNASPLVGRGRALRISTDYLVADIQDITPDPRLTAVDHVVIRFNKPVTGFNTNDLQLTRDGTNVALTGATLESQDNQEFTLRGLAVVTDLDGAYELNVRSFDSGIVAQSGYPLPVGVSDSWQKISKFGPDEFGYEGRFIDYRADLDLDPSDPNVITLISNADNVAQPIPLGANYLWLYDYYINSRLFVTENGLISVGNGITTPLHTDLSFPAAPVIAALWDDWVADPAYGGKVLYRIDDLNGDDTPDRLVIEWDHVRKAGRDGTATFQAALELNTKTRRGDVILNFADLDLAGTDADNGAVGTVGIKGAGLDSAKLLISYDNGVNTLLKSGTTLLIAPRHASVTAIAIDSSAWADSFRQSFNPTLVQGGGYPLVGSTNQTASLPWTNIDQIKVRFSQDVVIHKENLVLTGSRGNNYETAGFKYDPFTLTAKFSLAGPLPADAVTLKLVNVTDTAGRDLDGEWHDSASIFPSGDGESGGEFSFRLHILPADVNQSGGAVNASDLVQVRNRLGRSTANPGTGSSRYSPFLDVNGDGTIAAVDLVLVRNRIGSQLPVLPSAKSLFGTDMIDLGYAKPKTRLDVDLETGHVSSPSI